MYNHSEIDAKWQKKWEESQVFRALDPSETKKDPFYCLVEFPFPSGAGLHVGHPRSYTALDVVARKRRMEGFNVLYPMGWDAFGLPTENYAIKTGRPPSEVTAENVAVFTRQLKALGLSFDWSREVNTTDPAYYKWTQWMFLEMFKAGLAYKAKMAINWCPKDKIGLANEEVVNGCCERCGNPVEKRDKEQWMIAITKYADRLLEDLDTVNYLPKIRKQQEDWIGRSEGAEIDFTVEATGEKLTVFTTRPDTLFGVTFLAVSPDHPVLDSIVPADQKAAVEAFREEARRTQLADMGMEDGTEKEKNGVFTGAYVLNPANNERVPLWVGDYVLMGYGTGAVMGVPAHDGRDFVFAKKYGIEIRQVVQTGGSMSGHIDAATQVPHIQYFSDEWNEHYSNDGTLWNSSHFDGLSSEEARLTITKWLEEKGAGRPRVTYRLRDWVFSRQRYWGEPIPLVYCDSCESRKYNFVLLHGFSGSPEANFFPGLIHRLQEKGHTVYAPQLPNADAPNVDEQVEFTLQNAGFDENTILVGHSLGSVVMHKLLAKLPNPVKQSIFIDGFVTSDFNDHDRELVHASTDWEFDFEAAKKNAGHVTVIGDSTASVIPKTQNEQVAAAYGAVVSWHHPQEEHFCAKDEPAVFGAVIPTGWVPLPDSELPLTLPVVEKYEPTDNGDSPLASVADWVNTKCPQCGGVATRETDTMPNWAGSSWYFLRYIDPHNDEQFASKEKLDYWMPVNWYNGGMEHTTLHLLYSRFWNKFLYDRGHVTSAEPYARRTSHGLIMAEDGTKMSKSKGNVVNPDDIVKEYGADTARVYELFMGPFSEPVPWSTAGVIGVRRFLDRVMKLTELVQAEEPIETTKAVHKTVHSVMQAVEDMKFNTAVASLMSCVNEIAPAKAITKETLTAFLAVFGWFAPHVANEINATIGGNELSETLPLPQVNKELLTDDTMVISVQVNGKLRATIEVASDADEATITAAARAHENVVKYVTGEPKKVIYIQGKIVSIVV